MTTPITAPDFQALVRKLYAAETGRPYTFGSLSQAEKHAIQRRYEITRRSERDGGGFVARPKRAELAA